VIRGFSREVDENCVFRAITPRVVVILCRSQEENSLLLKMGLIGCPETSIGNYGDSLPQKSAVLIAVTLVPKVLISRLSDVNKYFNASPFTTVYHIPRDNSQAGPCFIIALLTTTTFGLKAVKSCCELPGRCYSYRVCSYHKHNCLLVFICRNYMATCFDQRFLSSGKRVT
jgi:hypothetical protein